MTLAELKAEALEWLNQQCDSRGECDRCHRDAQLWQLPSDLDDAPPEAGFQYCAACYRRVVDYIADSEYKR